MASTSTAFDHLARSAGLDGGKLPENTEEADIAEGILAQELDRLSLDERERIIFDLHGIPQTDNDDPPTMESKLNELIYELCKRKNKDAFWETRNINKDFVINKHFLLQFLRKNAFDVRLTIDMIIRHFDMKRRIFGGGEILARDIRQSDLNEKEMQFLHLGYMQLLPTRDPAGRVVMCVTGDFASENILEEMARPFWYFIALLLRDEDAVVKGAVLVMYHSHDIRVELECLHDIRTNICMVIPYRRLGGHYCHNDPAYRPMLTELQLHSSKHDRFRIRQHMGTHEEVKFELQTFGIPTEDTPLQDDGTWSTVWNSEWLQSLGDQEEHDASLDIVVPRRFDILLGKTRRSLHHTGNRRLVHLCEMHFEEYCSANKHKKTEIADRLVTIVHESSGRFLNWTKYDGWVEVEGLVVRNKVAHYFRYLRAKVVKKRAYISSSEEAQSTDSSSSSDGSSIDNPESLTAVADSLAVSIQTKRAQKRKN